MDSLATVELSSHDVFFVCIGVSGKEHDKSRIERVRVVRTRISKLAKCVVASVFSIPLLISGSSASAETMGIQCTDIGNGLLCVNPYSAERIDVWYDKQGGGTVEVGLQYVANNPDDWEYAPEYLYMGNMSNNVPTLVSAGGRKFESYRRIESDGQCYAPKILVFGSGFSDSYTISGNFNCA